MVKKKIKVSKKEFLKKDILIYNWNKEHITKNWYKKDTTTWKTAFLFNILALLKANR